MSDYNRLIGVKWSLSNNNDPNQKLLNNSHVLLNSKTSFLLLFEVALLLLVIIGDYYIFDTLVLISKLNQISNLSDRIIRALMDNASHLLIGLLSWCIISYPKLTITELFLVSFFSSIIDIDHFISARSFSLSHAISLPSRPFLHNSLTLCLINLMIFLYFNVLTDSSKLNWTLMFFISWFSHHIRDANRRGMWFGSIYTSQPIKDSLYLAIISLTPLCLRFLKQSKFNLSDMLFARNGPDNFKAHNDSHVV